MKSAVEKLRQRLKWPVKIGDETIFIRGATHAELKDAESLKDKDDRAWFLFGTILVEDDGSQAISRNSEEPAGAFTARVCAEFTDVTMDVLAIVMSEYLRVMNPAEHRKLVKN